MRASPRKQLALEVAVVLPTGAALYFLFGYWRWGWIGPSGFFTTPDELYVYEWFNDAVRGHLGNTLPYGQFFHLLLFVATRGIQWLVPDALSLTRFTSVVRFVDALVWVAFASYCLALGVRRLWLAVILLNPVVVFMAFGYAKPDFLCFALSVLALLHWIHYSRHNRSLDLMLAAIFLGAALGTKATSVLTLPFYPLAFWTIRSTQSERQPVSLSRLSLAILVVAAVTAIASPQYLNVERTIEVLRSESAITRFGFPGANAYPGVYFLLILGLSFPVEILLSLYELTGGEFLRWTILAGWLGSCAVFAGLVRQETPTHLLTLIAVLVAVGLDRDAFNRHQHAVAPAIAIAVALCFSAVSLYPKLQLNVNFGPATSYGRAASFLQREGIRAKPLSEVAIGGDANMETVAHFWRPDSLTAVSKALEDPQAGYYLLTSDSYVKATVNPLRLGNLALPYAEAYRQFSNSYGDRAVFLEGHDLDADGRFREINVEGYWPWRYLLALMRREAIAPGPSVGVYGF